MKAAVSSEMEGGYPDTPSGWWSRWKTELDAAREASKKYREHGNTIVKRFLDDRDGERTSHGDTRWNIFTANVITLQSMLYGRTPTVDVGRRWADADDDVARVSSEMLERVVNADIERDGDGFELALRCALEDRQLPGMGCVRVRYEPSFEDVEGAEAILDEDGVELAPAVEATERKSGERVDFDYVPWRRFLWSPAETWREVRWVAFEALMSRRQLIERFGEKVGKLVPLNAVEKDKRKKTGTPWARASVWEIWDKETREVFWVCEGHRALLDRKPDPLGLKGFFPCPMPIIANSTTTAFMPRADFVLAQDLYNEVDILSTRITLLERAVRVVGVYDKSAAGVKQLLNNSAQNDLYPVDNWAMFAEKGGLKGVVDWLPLEQIYSALTVLQQYRRELVDALREITGMSDVMRGQAQAGATATEQRIKARSSSVRVQRLQDEFARFASDAAALKAEIILLHFEPETIIAQSNVMNTPDAPYAQAAVEFLKSDDTDFRIEVKSDAISMADFDSLKSERMEALTGMATFFSAMAPVVQQMPAALPYLLKILQWTMAGFRGGAGMESMLDQAIAAAEAQAQQPQQAAAPDPKLIAQQMKAQGDLAKTQADLQADLVRINAEVEADARREENQATWNVREAQAKQQVSALGKAMNPTDRERAP